MITRYPINHTIANGLSNGLFTELNRFVNHALAPEAGCDDGSCLLPASTELESISNDENGWKLRLELPGYNKDELKLSVDENFLTIEAETEDEERSFLGKTERRVKISDEVDVEGIKARLENGLLFLEIPRRVKAEPRSIVVN